MKHVPIIALLSLAPGLALATATPSPAAVTAPTYANIVFGGFMTLYDFAVPNIAAAAAAAAATTPAAGACGGASCVQAQIAAGSDSPHSGSTLMQAGDTPTGDDAPAAAAAPAVFAVTTVAALPTALPTAFAPPLPMPPMLDAVVPEPPTLAMAGLALATLVWTRRMLRAKSRPRRAAHRAA